MPDDNVIAVGDKDLLLTPGQDLVLQDRDGRKRLRLDAATGTISIRTAEGKLVLLLEAERANVWLGGSGQDGDLLLFPDAASSFEIDQATVHLNAGQPSLRLGNRQHAGQVSIEGGQHRIELDGSAGRVQTSGQVDVNTPHNQLRVRLNQDGTLMGGGDGADGRLQLRSSADGIRVGFDAATATGILGGAGASGTIRLRSPAAVERIVLNAATANGSFGGDGEAGGLFIKDASGADAIVLNGATGNLGLGRQGNGASLFVKDDSGEDTVVLNGATGSVGIGRDGREGTLFVKNRAGQNTIRLDGQSGDILLSNADCAEDFDLAPDVAAVEPGTVLTIDDQTHLRPADRPYDHRVIGVVSGAGSYQPALVLDRHPSIEHRAPIALIGKVYCKVDAGFAPIKAGDLLTTSPTLGHAMKAIDPQRTPGAVLGKALGDLARGQSLIPVIVTLH